MLINNTVLHNMFLYVAEIWQENTTLLGDIDARFGDGDHGVTIGKISREIVKNVEDNGANGICEFIEGLSDSILFISGGSAAPLYGTLIGGLAKPLNGETEIDGKLLKKMLQSSYDEMTAITKARVGDKTMMDALIPAVESVQTASDDILDTLKTAAVASKAGADSTQNIASKFGRARSYGDKTIGTCDAGAVSTSLFFQGLYEGFVKQKNHFNKEDSKI